MNAYNPQPGAATLVVFAGIDIDDGDRGVLQLDGIRIALGNTRVLIDPAQALLVPNKAVLGL